VNGSDRADGIVIVGGGVIGCAILFELARRGVRATLVERGMVGREASWASAGIISLPSRPAWRQERVELGRRSLERYPDLVEELEATTGIAIDYNRTGEWQIAVDAEHAAEEAARVVYQRGLGYAVEAVPPAEARQREPALPEALEAAWFVPGVGSLTVFRLTQAFAAAARALGATVLEQTPVGGLLRDGGRVAGVRLLDRDLPAATTVLATGAWTRFLGDAVGAALPTRPVKGQLVAFANAPVRPISVIAGHGGYVRPRPDGSVVVAATEEEAGFDRRVTGDGVAWLLDLTRTICPGLLAGEMVESWSGLRPGSDTGDPMMGPVPGTDGLWVAAGHFRTGAKEAPASGALVAAALAGEPPDPLLAAFAPPAAVGSGVAG
jgi:glycine oxidase